MNRQNFITDALKRIGDAGRKAQSSRPSADDTTTMEFLYVPCADARYNGHPGETHRWVQEVPIVKKTAKLIYFTSDSWNWHEAAVSPGCISREQFEADTRCPTEARCRHGYPAGVIPIPCDRRRAGLDGRLFFATREAAEAYLRRAERERTGQAAQETEFIKGLRRAMADAHPDHGGTAGQFIQARRRYETALQEARR